MFAPSKGDALTLPGDQNCPTELGLKASGPHSPFRRNQSLQNNRPRPAGRKHVPRRSWARPSPNRRCEKPPASRAPGRRIPRCSTRPIDCVCCSSPHLQPPTHPALWGPGATATMRTRHSHAVCREARCRAGTRCAVHPLLYACQAANCCRLLFCLCSGVTTFRRSSLGI